MTDLIENNPLLSPVSDAPLVAILLCTYNGARFLTEQLDSLESQTHQNWIVFASDDGSTDHTLEILRQYQAKWPAGKLTIRSGPQKGFCQNFLSLACDPEIKADYYAFCDQDDVWMPEKISTALSILNSNENRRPNLYCGRTIYISELGDEIGMSRKFIHPKTFRNALVQCIAGGNTMVFDAKAKALMELTPNVDVPSHDWWLYQLVTGYGGIVYYDLNPHIKYRQHPNSLVGKNTSLISRIDRLGMVLNGRFREMISKNIAAIEVSLFFLTEENKEIFNLFKKMREQRLKDRIRLIEVCGIYRQSWQGTLSLLLAAILKRI
ncbi:glycosyltransferase family 2 protein [Polynucleobacter paneuropaeus]|nr:glycosyltransferase family 2 protein [Polynucleobacter paneuropaeus]